MQGVFFCDYPIITESLLFLKVMKEDPFKPAPVNVAMRLVKSENCGKVPPVCGITIPGRNFLFINSVDFLEDIYVKQNAYNTKAMTDHQVFAMIGQQNVLFMNTFHKDYNATRKSLSPAFFKSKL